MSGQKVSADVARDEFGRLCKFARMADSELEDAEKAEAAFKAAESETDKADPEGMKRLERLKLNEDQESLLTLRDKICAGIQRGALTVNDEGLASLMGPESPLVFHYPNGAAFMAGEGKEHGGAQMAARVEKMTRSEPGTVASLPFDLFMLAASLYAIFFQGS